MFDEMIHDVEALLMHQPKVLEYLVDDSKKLLYPGCTRFTRLSTTLKLCKLKVKNGWSDKSFTEILKLLSKMLPPNNELPTSTYEAKKILCPMGRKSDGMLRDSVDSPQWRTIDEKFSEFGQEAINLRLGLCTDGMTHIAL
ncbi:hypothetical protein AgCh_020310 [Apium graveolens]